jgi:acyl-CoA hydrolase
MMECFALVRPEHLNHHGYLFGGSMLKWVDEYAWLAASREYHGCSLVTVAMDKIVFREPVQNGSILRFDVQRERQGTTSVTYSVNVHADAPGAAHEKHVFATQVTFVCIGPDGIKQPLPRRQAPTGP